jgi:hypothetical protein
MAHNVLLLPHSWHWNAVHVEVMVMFIQIVKGLIWKMCDRHHRLCIPILILMPNLPVELSKHSTLLPTILKTVQNHSEPAKELQLCLPFVTLYIFSETQYSSNISSLENSLVFCLTTFVITQNNCPCIMQLICTI